MNIHDAGITHGDMEYPERNVVVRPDGDIRIVDFELAQSHECERKRGPPIVDAFSENPYTYGCWETWHVHDSILWTPGKYLISTVSSQSH